MKKYWKWTFRYIKLVCCRRSGQLSRTPSPVADLHNKFSADLNTTIASAGSFSKSNSAHRVGTIVDGGGSATVLEGMHGSSRYNAELRGSLRNLKAVEYQLQCAERALFPQSKSGRNSAMGSCSEDDYLAQLERINQELRGFIPIERPCQQ